VRRRTDASEITEQTNALFVWHDSHQGLRT
jgi:hypothetical protein